MVASKEARLAIAQANLDPYLLWPRLSNTNYVLAVAPFSGAVVE